MFVAVINQGVNKFENARKSKVKFLFKLSFIALNVTKKQNKNK